MQNSPLKAEHNTSKRAAQPPQLAVPADDDYLQDEGFLNLLEIEKMTAQTEKDVAKYQRYTEKRYNTERFIEEMEMKCSKSPRTDLRTGAIKPMFSGAKISFSNYLNNPSFTRSLIR